MVHWIWPIITTITGIAIGSVTGVYFTLCWIERKLAHKDEV